VKKKAFAILVSTRALCALRHRQKGEDEGDSANKRFRGGLRLRLAKQKKTSKRKTTKISNGN